MRAKINPQGEINFSPSHLKVTNRYYATYEMMSRILDENPQIIDLLHQGLEKPLKYCSAKGKEGRWHRYTSDNVLRILLVQVIERLSLRRTVVRIDDSDGLRQFTRIYNRPMMDFTTLDKLKNSIRPETWEKVNRALAVYAREQDLIDGNDLRIDTTAVETNIHYPTDSSLLWDEYRVLARLIEHGRKIDPEVAGNRRLHRRRAKRLAMRIGRRSRGKRSSAQALQPLYKDLIGRVEGIFEWGLSVADDLRKRLHLYGPTQAALAEGIIGQIHHFVFLGRKVVDQSRRRVLFGEVVPNDEKLFSIFEEHTELLKRGKAGKPIEFGHMIQIQQVRKKFITGYAVFEKRPVENGLLDPAVEEHRKLFGRYPDCVCAYRAYWKDQPIESMREKIAVVSVGKNGTRNEEDRERERCPEFRAGQRFRAGVEGTISFIKRCLRLARCFNKGWIHYACTVGTAVLAHNLLTLARN